MYFSLEGKILLEDPLQMKHGRQWPPYINKTVFDRLTLLNHLYYDTKYGAEPIMAKLRGGLLLNDVVSRTQDAANNKTGKLRLYGYSAVS